MVFNHRASGTENGEEQSSEMSEATNGSGQQSGSRGSEGSSSSSSSSSMYQHQYCSKIRVSDLNEHLMCVLCGGYFIDATTIIECLHSFCRSCIVRYLESSKYCPICDVQVHKTRPLINIRADKTLQDLVYKLIPGLFDEEMVRRRQFLQAHPEVKTGGMDLEQRGQALLVPVHAIPSHKVSLVLHVAPGGRDTCSETKRTTVRSKKAGDRRYLLCPSDVTMGILKKFLRCKFNLSDKYQIDMFHTHREEAISDEFTLLDITFIYSWNREKPLRLFYTVYEKPRRRRRLLSDRLRNLQSSQAKRARLESNGGPPVKSTSKTYPPPPRKAGVLSKHVSQQSARQKAEAKKTSFWKLHHREKLKAKRKALEKVQKIGRKIKDTEVKEARKATSSLDNETGAFMDSPRATGGESESKLNVKSSVGRALLNNRPLAKAPSSFLESYSKWVDSKVSVGGGGGGDRPGSPRGQGKPPVAVVPLNGVCRPPLRTSVDGRSASPRLSTPGSSRSSSPRLPPSSSSSSTATKGRAPGCGARDSREGRKESGGRERSSGGGSPRAVEEPPPAPLSDRLPSVPVSEKISVDVSMMSASSSETSSDVTSPGAEDRAHSGGLEEPRDFPGNGGHVCNAATFNPRPLPSLHVHNHAHKQSSVNGNGPTLGINSGTAYKLNGNKCSASQKTKEKVSTHKQNSDNKGGKQQNTNEKGRDVVTKVNGHARDVGKVTGTGQSENKIHGNNKPGINRGSQTKEQFKPPKSSQLNVKATNKTSNKKR